MEYFLYVTDLKIKSNTFTLQRRDSKHKNDVDGYFPPINIRGKFLRLCLFIKWNLFIKDKQLSLELLQTSVLLYQYQKTGE